MYAANATAVVAGRNPLGYIAGHIVDTCRVLQGISRAEGMTALWKGMGATMVGVIPARAIYFSTYSTAKCHLTAINGNCEDSMVHLGAAVVAGVTVATATNPIWMIKTRMQLSRQADMSNWACIVGIVRQEGVKGLYKGMTASYLGVIEGTMQWVLYERAKHRYLQADGREPRWAELFGTAAASKFVAAIIAYPHEVLRTRLRETTSMHIDGREIKVRRYTGLWQAARLVVREEGAAALYGGMTAHLMRVVPNSAIMFFCYEMLLQAYNRFDSRINAVVEKQVTAGMDDQ